MNDEAKDSGESSVSRGFFGFTRTLAKVIQWSVIAVAAVGILAAFDIPRHLLTGWVEHLRNTLPDLAAKWPALLPPLLCLAMALPLAHRFLSWLAIGGRENERWKLSHSASLVGLLLLGSAAAIAMSGIVHQLAWLSRRPLMESSRPSLRMAAMIQIRDLLRVVEKFREQHDRYPESLAELGSFDPEAKKLTWIVTGGGKVAERVIYLKPASISQEAPAPVFVSAVLGNPGHVVIGFSDLSVTPMVPAKVDEILNQLGNEH
ncbi:hypothetical protein [Luteolibacter sp. Populi]|uniref:hypothetical protein n=1 Tax=Luteolibacter sp. Populi TaxID=3230487 RepID=UPI00346604A1